MLKFNPFDYPLAILAGGIILVTGVRLLQLNNYVVIPVSGAVTVGAAIFRDRQQQQKLSLSNDPQQSLVIVASQAKRLAQLAAKLNTEAAKILNLDGELELLGQINYICDRLTELPKQLENDESRSLLSAGAIERELRTIEAKKDLKLQPLVTSLQRNLAMAREKQNLQIERRIAFVTILTEAQGSLQKVQNLLQQSSNNRQEEIAIEVERLMSLAKVIYES